MKKPKVAIDWREDLPEFLIQAGIIGRPWSDILAKFNAQADKAEIEHELEALRAEDKAQKFEVPMGKKKAPSVIWRATTKIRM